MPTNMAQESFKSLTGSICDDMKISHWKYITVEIILCRKYTNVGHCSFNSTESDTNKLLKEKADV